MRLRGKERRELQVHPERAPWTESVHPHRVVGVHRHVRVTVVGPEVGAYNGFSERLVAADLRHLADWLEQTADHRTGSVQLGPADEGIRLEHRGEGSLVVELRGELRPWYWEEPAEVVEFKLEVDAADLLQAALDLREELEAWLA